ncbi:MAG: metal-dependent hydrolase [Vicinamibacteria bacterium]
MDNLTHSLTGLALARAGLGRFSKGATLALVLASNLPDVDLVTAASGSAVYLEHHRGVSHSIVGAPLMALGLALGLRLFVRGSRLLPLLGCSLAGVAGHVFMDLWTSYGTRVLSPFDRRWLTWDLVFIVDPWILALLLIAVLWKRGIPQSPQIATTALGLVLAYVGLRAVTHAQALDLAAARLPRPAARMAALPSPVDPFRWRVLADTGDAVYVGDLNVLGRSSPLARREKRAHDAAVAAAAAKSEVAAVFLDFSTFPWVEVKETPEGTEVRWHDLRFERPERETFVATVLLDKAGRVLRQEFRF